MTDLTAPQGVDVHPLDEAQARRVLDEVFARRRCTVLDGLDPGARQWVLAEFGDGRLTGVCRKGEDQWEWEFVGGGSGGDDRRRSGHSGAGEPTGAGDYWRLLELTVFTKDAQVRVGEHAAYAHTAVEGPAPEDESLQPSTRHFLLLGWLKKQNAEAEQAGGPREYIVPAGPNQGLVRAKEMSGSEAVHPLRWDEWTDFKAEKIPDTRPVRHTSHGSWLRVREYWAQDPTTGAVHVAYHRLAGYATNPVTEEEEQR